MMMTDYDNDNSLACGPSNSPTHQNTKALPDQPLSRTLPAAIRLLLRLKWHSCGALNGTFVALPLTQFELQPNFHMYIYIYVQYTYYQWVKHGLIFLKLCAASSSSSPLSNQMDPVVSLTCRSIFPPSPTETQLKCSPPHLYKNDSWLRI